MARNDRIHDRKPPRGIILDMDSSESPTHGEQEGSVWNGHFGCTCYHPLFVFNQYGDLERCRLRPGNVHSAEDWRLVLEPVIARYRERGVDLYFRADAAFANPELYELLNHETRSGACSLARCAGTAHGRSSGAGIWGIPVELTLVRSGLPYRRRRLRCTSTRCTPR
jgi:hypothetical protein